MQKNEITVQSELTYALCTLTKNINTKVILAGRTDAKVSAKNQAAHFDSSFEIKDKIKFLISLNALLPKSIRVFEIESVASFHAQKSATYRHYQYKINNSPYKNSVFDLNVYHTRQKLNTERMNQAISFIKGEHDFSAFKSVSDNPSNVGNRFLYNMVRAIVGTLFLIESKDLTPFFMKDVLESKQRKNAGANIDAIGLTLIKTGYDNPLEYIKNLNERQI